MRAAMPTFGNTWANERHPLDIPGDAVLAL